MVSSGKISCIVLFMHVEYLLMHVHALVGVNVSVITESISARQYKSGSILGSTYVRSVICAGAYE